MDVFGSSEKNPQDILKQALIDFFLKLEKKGVPGLRTVVYVRNGFNILAKKYWLLVL